MPSSRAVLYFTAAIYSKGLPITHKATVEREITKFLKMHEQNFSTMGSWYKWIMHCTGLSLRRAISIYQKLSTDFKQNAINFQHDAIEEKLKYVFN